MVGITITLTSFCALLHMFCIHVSHADTFFYYYSHVNPFFDASNASVSYTTTAVYEHMQVDSKVILHRLGRTIQNEYK